MKKILLILFVLLANVAFAQRTVSGLITDKANKPIENVTVSIKNCNAKTVTNMAGEYSIGVPENCKTLEFSKSGFKVQVMEITGDVISITMTSLADVNIFELTLEELMNVQVISVSKTKEKLSDAPANVRVITQNDLESNGYTSLLDVFENLPGFDVSKSFGSDYFHNYMRGFRSYVGSYYLVLIDGISFDGLWFQDDKILATFPLSNIERIEIIYGPSSSLYGVNALMGLVNIITKKDIESANNVSFDGQFSTGFNSLSIADFNFRSKHGIVETSVTARLENNNIKDLVDNNSYEWTKDKYLSDKSIWGNMVDDPSLGGNFSSETKNTAVDARIFIKNTELGFQFYKLDPGQGCYSAVDQTRSQNRFGREELSVHLKHNQILIEDKLTSTSTLRFRKSDIPSDAPFIYAWNGTENNLPARMVNISLYQSLNSSWSFTQDFVATFNKRINMVGGFVYEQKSLQRDYDVSSGTTVNVNDFNFNTYQYPAAMARYNNYANRLFQTESGIYLQGNVEYITNQRLVLGARYNNNSQFGDIYVLRSALISQFNNFTFKLLYGEGIQAPPPRTLYGSWSFQGKNQDLKPIKAQTTELNINYLTKYINATVSGYYIISKNTILQTSEGAENVGGKKVYGIDVFLKAIVNQFLFVKNTQLWINYGYCNAQGEEKPIANTNNFEWGTLGDITPHKLYFGVNFNFTDNIMFNLHGKYMSQRDAIYSNPVGTIKSFNTFDCNLIYKNIFKTGLGLSFNVKNITNQQYFHPGVGSADAGVTEGFWENGIWNGSSGYYSSLLPQPHRLFILSLTNKF